MATLLIQQPDGLFCVFGTETASFLMTDLPEQSAATAAYELLMCLPSWAGNPDGAGARVASMIDTTKRSPDRWAIARRRVCQAHGPDAAEWMLAVERKAFVHAFNNATPEQVEAAIATLSPEGQAWARDFEAKGER